MSTPSPSERACPSTRRRIARSKRLPTSALGLLALALPAMVPCGLVATPPVTSSFTDSQGLTALYRYSLQDHWDPEQARGLLMYFHGQSNAAPEEMLTSLESVRPLAYERGLVPVVVVSPRADRHAPSFFAPVPGYGTRYWYPEDARLVHELLQSGLESGVSIDYDRVFFWGDSQGPCFLSYFLEKYGAVYGGGFYARCGCFFGDDRERAGVQWTPSVHWTAASASALSKRLRVFVQATTEDFLHPEAERMYDYYKNTLGLETRADLEAPGGHCAGGAVSPGEALDWLVDGGSARVLTPVRSSDDADDTDGDGVVNDLDTDDDGDGAADIIDAAPLDAREWLDTDADGIGDFADSDADGDGYDNAVDAFPRNPREWLDTDGDGIGHNLDPDDHAVGVPDIRDEAPSPRLPRSRTTVLQALREGYYGWEAAGPVLVAQPHAAMPVTFLYPRPHGDRQHYQFITLGDGPGAEVQVMVDRFRLARSPAEGSLVPYEYDPSTIDLVYIDRDGNGNLRDDGPPSIAPSLASGAAWIEVRYASGEVVPYGIRFHVDASGSLRYRFNSSWLGEVATPHGAPILAGAVDRNSDGLFTVPDRSAAFATSSPRASEHPDLLCIDLNRDTHLFCWDYWWNLLGPEAVYLDNPFLVDGQFLQAGITPSGRTIHFEFAGFMRDGGAGAEPVPPPSIASGGIVLADLHGESTALAPGAVASVLGSGFARPPATARGSLNEARRIGNRIFDVCLTVNGVKAPLFYVSEGRITFQVPAETAVGTARVEVVVECGTERERRSAAAAVQITPRRPAFLLFTRDPPRILYKRYRHQPTLPAAPELDFPGELTTGPLPVPVSHGEVPVLYATGFGATQPTLQTGELAPGRRRLSAGSVRVWLGGSELASDDVLYAGAAPGYAGLYELQVRIPERTPPGKAKVVVAIDGVRSRDGPYVEIARLRHMAGVQPFRDCAECPEMVVVRAGSFLMGAPETEDYPRTDQERPVHRVTIDKPFAIGVYEVTFEEWDACVADGGCNRGHIPRDEGWGRQRRPVMNVRWEDAQAYAAWLSQKTGLAYRLPSEAEWEYAARAWTQTAYSFGDSILTSQANFWTTGLRQTLPVGSFEPNAFGLFDMHGNVGEWVQDCWHPSYEGAPTDGSAWETGTCLERVERGGSHDLPDFLLRSASRFNWPDHYSHHTVGFRVAKTLQR